MTDTPKADERLAEMRAELAAVDDRASEHDDIEWLLDEIDRRDAERDELRSENAKLEAVAKTEHHPVLDQYTTDLLGNVLSAQYRCACFRIWPCPKLAALHEDREP